MKQCSVTLLSLCLVACSTTRTLAIPPVGYGMEDVSAGDRVELVLYDGERSTVEVDRADDRGLHAGGKIYRYTDIQSATLVRKAEAGTDPWMWILLGLLVVALAAGDSGDDGLGPFCVYSSTDPDPDC
jgi:hypothetical protein